MVAYLRSQAVEQRDRERTPFHDDCSLRGIWTGEHSVVPGRQQLQVKEQTPVAIFRQTGEFVNPSDSDTGRQHGLDERVGQPLGQLVERHEAGGKPWAGNLSVMPDIAQIDSAYVKTPWPDRAETLKYRAQNLASRHGSC
jgi:hypothetical protein